MGCDWVTICHDASRYAHLSGRRLSLPNHTMDNTDDAAEYSNSQLATLLADAYKDVDNLRRELATAKKRAEKAERLLVGLQTIQQSAAEVSSSSGQSPDVARMIMDYEDRLSRAERARDDAEARRRAIQENWLSLERYLAHIEHRAHDARSHFARIVSGDNTTLSLPSLTPYAPASVSPLLPRSSPVLIGTSTRTLPTSFHPSHRTQIPTQGGGHVPRAWTRTFHSLPPSDQEATTTIAADATLTPCVHHHHKLDFPF